MKYYSEEGLRGSRELQSFQPKAGAGEGHGAHNLECHPMAHAGQPRRQAQPAQVCKWQVLLDQPYLLL